VDQRDLKQEEQNGKRKGGIERKMFFFGFVIFNQNQKSERN
jgi:hypothetical protein